MVMKDSGSCTLHTEERTPSQSRLQVTVQGLSDTDWCHYRSGLTHRVRDNPACKVGHVQPLYFLFLQKPPTVYTPEELPVIISTIYYSASPLTQFWFHGGFPDSPELSKNLDTVTLALGSSTSSALCSVNITLWCIYVCQILIPTFAARKTSHPSALPLWLTYISCSLMIHVFSLSSIFNALSVSGVTYNFKVWQ